MEITVGVDPAAVAGRNPGVVPPDLDLAERAGRAEDDGASGGGVAVGPVADEETGYVG